jgi:hypothetical protein
MNDVAGNDIAPGGTSRLSIAGSWRIHGHRLLSGGINVSDGSCGATPSLSHVEEALQVVTHALTVRVCWTFRRTCPPSRCP